MRRAFAGVACALAGSLTWGLCGCASRGGAPVVAFEPARSGAAFEAAKDVLREAGFTLDRVDARAGIISTRPLASAGLFTPWVRVTPGVENTLEATVQAQQRVVTVFFDGAGGVEGEAAYEGLRVRVDVLRLVRPMRRYDPTSIRFASRPVDPTAETPEVELLQVGEDEELAAVLGERIRSRVLNRS